MVWVDHADVFDFDVFLNWVCLPKTYAGFGSECNRAVDRYYLYGLLDHATFTFSRKITCFRIRSRKVNDCMFPGEAAFLEGSAASMSANGAEVDQPRYLHGIRINLTKRTRNHGCLEAPRIGGCWYVPFH
jgi:hypothetical protein